MNIADTLVHFKTDPNVAKYYSTSSNIVEVSNENGGQIFGPF
jgi:hypothetical protein